MLHRGESVDAIAAWLTDLVEVRIGVRTHRAREREFAQTLIDWWAFATAV